MSLDRVFHALGDATRRQMLQALAHGEQTVGQLAEPHAMSLAAASKHIKALEGAGLIRRDVRGRSHVCQLEPGPLADAHAWISHYQAFWRGRLDTLEQLLRAEDTAAKQPSTKTETKQARARPASATPARAKRPRTKP